jgi:hypothetical protein
MSSPDLECDAMSFCQFCGYAGQLCCKGSCATADLSCALDICQACGSKDAPCCAGSVCMSGLVCAMEGICT